MVSFKEIGVALLALSMQTFAATLPKREPPSLVERQATTTTTRVPDSQCTWGPTTRGCWKDGFSIATDFDTKWPDTGVTRKYRLEVTNVTDCNEISNKGIGDGFCRPMLLFNGQFPGPTLTADWGDMFEIEVVNSMQDNGTSIHWHGMRQLNTCEMDGANGVTECPIAPGKSFTYKWRATQYGTTWYHSHHSAQYGDGVAGAIVINGPATANYDVDLGPVALTETYDQTAWAKNWAVIHSAAPPQPLNVLFNGSMVNSTGGGKYNTITVEQGKTYRLRLINMSVDTFFVVSLDGHDFQIITSDLVPVEPVNATSIMIGIGQRYDIVFTADQPASNYWIRTDIASCSTNQITTNSGIVPGGILNYQNISKTDLPVSTKSAIETTDCAQEPYTKLKPWWRTTVPQADFYSAYQGINLTFSPNTTYGNVSGIVQWLLNDTAMNVDWAKPTLQYMADGNTDYANSMNVLQMNTPNKWYFWHIQNNFIAFPIEHPIHLHGHDFFHLGAGTGQWDGDVSKLTFDNPMRRDVMVLPAATDGGYLIIGFPADNPGAWLMHCHIAWHVTDGLSVQFVENPTQFNNDLSSFEQVCSDWKNYKPAYEKELGDSGL